MIKLRNYQDKLITDTRKALQYKRRVAVYLSQGGGKSIIAAFMALHSSVRGKKTLILSHRIEILKQNFNKIDKLGVKVGMLTAKVKEIPTGTVICAMSQTLRARVANIKTKERYSDLLGSFNFVIVDELHRAEHDTIIDMLSPDVWLVGLSGTILRSGNQRQLGDFYQEIVRGVPAQELIDLGYLLPSDNYVFDAPKLEDVNIEYGTGDYNQIQLQKRFAKPERYAGIVKNYLRICPNKKVIVFTTGADHCVELTREFCNNGIKAKYLLSGEHRRHHRHLSGNRDDVVGMLRSGEIDVLVSVEMLSTGLDVPEVEGVILDFSTKSYTKYQQCVARADRPYANQTSFYVLDFGANVANFGKFEKEPIMSLWHNKGGSGVAPTKFCPTDKADHTGRMGCGSIIPVSMMQCKYCGYEWLTDKEAYEVELTRLVETKENEKETIQQFCARKKLEGWPSNRILCAVVFKNKDNQKLAFMEAIKVLRGVNGEMISPKYWYFFKKIYIDKARNKLKS